MKAIRPLQTTIFLFSHDGVYLIHIATSDGKFLHITRFSNLIAAKSFVEDLSSLTGLPTYIDVENVTP